MVIESIRSALGVGESALQYVHSGGAAAGGGRPPGPGIYVTADEPEGTEAWRVL